MHRDLLAFAGRRRTARRLAALGLLSVVGCGGLSSAPPADAALPAVDAGSLDAPLADATGPDAGSPPDAALQPDGGWIDGGANPAVLWLAPIGFSEVNLQLSPIEPNPF